MRVGWCGGMDFMGRGTVVIGTSDWCGGPELGRAPPVTSPLFGGEVGLSGPGEGAAHTQQHETSPIQGSPSPAAETATSPAGGRGDMLWLLRLEVAFTSSFEIPCSTFCGSISGSR